MDTPVVEAHSQAARVQIVRSPGGIEAWLVEDYAVPLVALDFAVRGGGSQDESGREGAAVLLAGVLDEGAGPLDSAAFQRALDDRAIELRFGADRDALTGRLRTLTKDMDEAFNLLRLALNEARLDAEPIDRVRGQLEAGVRHAAQDPESVASKAWRELAFPGHVYAAQTRGTLESLPRVARDDLVRARAHSLARDTLKIAVVGAIDAARTARMLDDVFGALPAKAERVAVPDILIAGMGRREVIDMAVPQSVIRFGRPGLKRRDPDFMASLVVNHILGGGAFSCRLFREVREKRGLAYSVYSSVSNDDHTDYFYGGTSTKNERALESLDVIQAEIDDIAKNGPSEDELDKAKKYLTGSYALRFDTSTKIAGQLVHLQNEGFGVAYLDERNREIDAVTMEDARRVSKRLLGDGKLLIAIVGKPAGV